MRNEGGVFINPFLIVKYIYNPMHILLAQAIFVTIFYKSFTCIKHKDSSAGLGIFFINHNNACRYTCTIKQVCRKTNDAFDVSFSNQVSSDFSLCVSTKQNTMRKDNGSFTLAF